MSELAKRWAVALVGVPVVVGLLYAGGWILALPVAVIAALGAHELYGLARVGARPFEGLGTGAAVALVLAAAWRPRPTELAPWAIGVVVVLLGTALVGAVFRRRPEQAPMGSVAVTCFGALYVGVPMACVPLLHALPVEGGWTGVPASPWAGCYLVALPLAAAWVGDAVAFFAGRAWGRAKLAPAISPKKTWVGAGAGLAGAGAAGVTWYLVVHGALPGMPVTSAVVAGAGGVLLGVAAQVGDLAESLLKREAGIKDSGGLFPGHGGVLDRLDALTLSLPVAYGILILAEARP